MYEFPPSLESLIGALRALPGVGRKTAQRLALALLKEEGVRLALREALEGVESRLRRCSVCGNFSEGELCSICADRARDHSVIMVVENAFDIIPFEQARLFNGVYHILGGALSPIEGVSPEDISFKELLSRVDAGDIKEVIVATDPDTEGEATAFYIAQALKGKVKVTRIARGVPIGSSLEFADEMTLYRSLEGRQEL